MKFVDVDKIIWRQSPFLTVSGLSDPQGKLKFDLFVTSADLDEMPPADVVERKKGKWIKKMRIIETDKYASYTPEWYCSCCGEGYAPYIAELISFCPNCGADMREEKTDG